MNKSKREGSTHSNAEATLASRLEAGILGDVRIVQIVVFDEVKIALKGGDGDGLGRDLMRLGGTEEGGGDAEAGNEEEEGGADHSSALMEERDWVVAMVSPSSLINQAPSAAAEQQCSCHLIVRGRPTYYRVRVVRGTYLCT